MNSIRFKKRFSLLLMVSLLMFIASSFVLPASAFAEPGGQETKKVEGLFTINSYDSSSHIELLGKGTNKVEVTPNFDEVKVNLYYEKTGIKNPLHPDIKHNVPETSDTDASTIIVAATAILGIFALYKAKKLNRALGVLALVLVGITFTTQSAIAAPTRYKIGDVIKGSYEPSASVVLEAPEVEGWKYVGYTVESNPYKVSFVDEFDSENPNTLLSSKCEPNSKTPTIATDDLPVHEGYEFVGWSPKVADRVSENVTYKACWKEITYKVAFDTQGGNKIDTQNVALNNKAQMPQDPTREGYTFVGWQMDGVDFDFDTAVTKDITLKAVWKINSYTVTFDTQGGAAIDSVDVEYKNKCEKPQDPTREGYTFVGWKIDGADFDFDTAITKDITLKAVWKINTYTVTFDTQEGTAVDAQQVTYNECAQKPQNPTREGYKFVGWELDGKEFEFTTPIKGDCTIKAIWSDSWYSYYKPGTNNETLVITINKNEAQAHAPFVERGVFKAASSVKNIECKDNIEIKPEDQYKFSGYTNLQDLSQLEKWDVSQVSDFSNMFSDCASLTSTSAFSGWDTSKASYMNSMFKGCSSLEDLSGLANFKLNSVVNTVAMFSGCSSLESVSDLSQWKTDSLVYMDEMFKGCSKLKNLDGIDGFDIKGVLSLNYVFQGDSSLTDISGLKDWNPAKTTSMFYTFDGCKSLPNLEGLNNWDVSSVQNFAGTFTNCSSLTTLSALSSWNVGSATRIDYMFANCSGLTNLSGLENWNTINVNSTNNAFQVCYNLSDLSALKDWKMGRVVFMQQMFYNCNNITNLDGLSEWKFEALANMSGLFKNCNRLVDTKGLSKWQVRNAQNMSELFMNCYNLKDISGVTGWATGNVTTMQNMFYKVYYLDLSTADNLKYWRVDKLNNKDGMFTEVVSGARPEWF